MSRHSWGYPRPTLVDRVKKFFYDIGQAIEGQRKDTRSREERRAGKRYDGRKRNDGKFFGGVTTPKVVKELSVVREAKKK